MYAVEFQASIKDGIVHIPKEYQDIQNSMKEIFVVMYDFDNANLEQNSINDELDELFANSNNEIQVTMELAINTNEMVNDGIL